MCFQVSKKYLLLFAIVAVVCITACDRTVRTDDVDAGITDGAVDKGVIVTATPYVPDVTEGTDVDDSSDTLRSYYYLDLLRSDSFKLCGDIVGIGDICIQADGSKTVIMLLDLDERAVFTDDYMHFIYDSEELAFSMSSNETTIAAGDGYRAVPELEFLEVGQVLYDEVEVEYEAFVDIAGNLYRLFYKDDSIYAINDIRVHSLTDSFDADAFSIPRGYTICYGVDGVFDLFLYTMAGVDSEDLKAAMLSEWMESTER